MPIGSRYVHHLAIVTPTRAVADEVDDYGHAVPGEPTVVTVPGLIQPKTARELAQANQAGAGISSHTVFMARRAIGDGAYIRYEPDDGDRYEIAGPPRDFNFGTINDHLEIDCRRVVGDELATS